MTEASFFATPAEWRAWLVEHHATESELLVGFHKKGTGQPSMTWPESVDEALCFGWIDGVRRRIDDATYSIRFTPRKKSSIWSAVNVARVAELTELGLMQPTGLAAFALRTDAKTSVYSHENQAEFLPTETEAFKADEKAWSFFEKQPPSYRHAATWWVVGAKQQATRERRLATLIDDSANELRVKHLRR